jgi:site-specific recombinase XerD
MAECIKCKADLPDGALFCPSCGKRQGPQERKHHKRSNGTGSISKLSGNRTRPWLARKNGVSIGTYPTRAEAQKALERITDATITDKYNLTFRQIYDAWRPVQERKVTKSQMNCYTSAFNSCPELHDRQFRKIKKSDFQNVIIRLEQAGRSKSMCEKMRQLFSQLSKWALAEEIIQVNHSQHLDTVAKQLSTKEIFTNDDITAVQKSENRGAPIVLILLACGCRPNELFNVPLENCHEDYFIGGSKTEAGTDRLIVISALGLDAYQSLRTSAIKNNGQKLIDGFEGNRDLHNFAKREFRDLVKEIGHPELTMYCCRHTYITNAARSGVDQRALQQMVGHVDKETTKIYTHLNVEDLRTETKKMKTNAVCNKSVTRSEIDF